MRIESLSCFEDFILNQNTTSAQLIIAIFVAIVIEIMQEQIFIITSSALPSLWLKESHASLSGHLVVSVTLYFQFIVINTVFAFDFREIRGIKLNIQI